jgi:hypothetical protein
MSAFPAHLGDRAPYPARRTPIPPWTYRIGRGEVWGPVTDSYPLLALAAAQLSEDLTPIIRHLTGRPPTLLLGVREHPADAAVRLFGHGQGMLPTPASYHRLQPDGTRVVIQHMSHIPAWYGQGRQRVKG